DRLLTAAGGTPTRAHREIRKMTEAAERFSGLLQTQLHTERDAAFAEGNAHSGTQKMRELRLFWSVHDRATIARRALARMPDTGRAASHCAGRFFKSASAAGPNFSRRRRARLARLSSTTAFA